MRIKFIRKFFSLKSASMFIALLTAIFFANDGKDFLEGTSVLLAISLTAFIVGSLPNENKELSDLRS